MGYIYNGSINISDTTVKSIYLDLLTAANELELSELTENMQEYLISHEADWIRNNFFKIFQITEKSKPFTRLENFCQEIFNTNPATILDSDGFLELEADFLISLFKRDDIVLDEILIWESVIRWGIAQIKLNTDVSQWTNRDFIRLKKAVKNLIPHIRFFNISGMDHRTKIRPYKKILPKELKEEIKDYFFAQVPPKKFCKLPPRATKSELNESVANILDHLTITSIESVLMDISGFCQIAAWIDDNSEPYLPTDIPYDFSLLFRGSRDGMTNARKFHEICGYQGATLIIIKIVESNKILGGYNPDDWICDSSWTTRLNSFIFSMEKNGGTLKNVISRIKDPKHAIWNSAGNPGFGSDLQCF
ncbi:hypothetical protein C2G38_1165422 [Gigaspora rosea]|uniref:TLDc domain-containing protein n=1 Tax=Gigaspora rosea TaxID=44941 RepID=A0A397WB14_9GLOM|nr:hypothetical protein C2G38_1165422 [Gigaspora rosea]